MATIPETGEASSSSRVFLRIATRFWSGRDSTFAWALLAAVAICIALGVYLQARINIWNGEFFTAFERKATSDIAPLMWQFAAYVVAAGAVMGLTILARMTLQLRLREYISRQVLETWLGQQRFVRLHQRTGGSETPEFRIADDVRIATDLMVDLSVGFVTALLLGITFLAVLARIGGSLTLPALGITIPAYVLLGALIYAFFMSGLTSFLGWPLSRSIAVKNHREGGFRYRLTRLREAIPDISRNGGEGREQRSVIGALTDVVQSWASVIMAQSKVASIASSNAVLVGIVPYVMTVPKYFAGEMTLGDVMQLVTAFIQVQMALNWLVDNFVRFAEWRASANRVGEFVASLEALDHEPVIAPVDTAGKPAAAHASADAEPDAALIR